MRVLTSVLVLAAALALAPSAAAQCPSVSVGPYGAGCNPAGFDVPALKGGYDSVGCQLALKWSGNPGCCNTFLTGRLLLVGFQPTAIPAPGAGCMLLVQPTVVQFVPAAVESVVATIPPVPAAVQVYLQIANQYTTFGVQNDYNLTNGLALKVV